MKKIELLNFSFELFVDFGMEDAYAGDIFRPFEKGDEAPGIKAGRLSSRSQ